MHPSNLTHAAEKLIHYNLYYHLAVIFRQVFKIAHPFQQTQYKKNQRSETMNKNMP